MALQPASSPPARLPSGGTTDPPYGPLAESGMGNPFFYHQFQDDFDNQLGAAGIYTASGTGSVVHTSGDGGLALFSSTATASTFATIQLPAADFTLPGTGNNPPTTSTSVKKLFYLTRIQLSDVSLSAFIAGLCSISAATFTVGLQTVVDGVFFYKAPGGTVLQLLSVASAAQSPSGSGFTTTYNIPTAAYTLANATFIDLAFSLDRFQNLRIWVGPQLVGWIPQSGFGGTTGTSGVSTLPVVGPVMANYNFLSQATGMAGNVATPVMYTQANLSPTLGVSNGVTAAVKTMTADFHTAQKER